MAFVEILDIYTLFAQLSFLSVKKKHVPRNEKIDIGLKIADFKAIFFTFSKSIIFPKNLNQEEGGNSRLPKIKEDSMPKLKRKIIVR